MPKNLLARGMQVPGRAAGDDAVAPPTDDASAAMGVGNGPAIGNAVTQGLTNLAGGLGSLAATRPAGADLYPQLTIPPVAAPAAPAGLDAAAGSVPGATPAPALTSVASQTPPGSGITTDHTRETDPKTHSVEDFVAANSHLTPLDIQILQQGKLTPHDQILNSIHQATQSIRERDEAAAMMNYRDATKGLDPRVNPQHQAIITAETHKLAQAKIDAETKQMKSLAPFVVPAYLNTPGNIQAEQDARKAALANKPQG